MPPLMLALGVGLDVLLHHHHALDEDAVLVGDDAEHTALLAFIFTGDDFDTVVALDLDLAGDDGLELGCHVAFLPRQIR